MKAKVTDNTSLIINQTKQRAAIFLRLACDRVVEKARPVTPKDKGNLRQDILRTVVGLHGTIEWRKKYASYQERGARLDGSRKVKNYTTPGTGPHFAEDSIQEVTKDTGIIAKLANLL